MEHLFSDLHESIQHADLPHKCQKMLLEILGKGLEGVRRYKAVRLVRFLQTIKHGRFGLLSTIEKKALLENFLNLTMQGIEKPLNDICHLLFEEDMVYSPSCEPLPDKMIKALVRIFASERADSLREIVWRILIKKGTKLSEMISANQLAPALWSVNPIFRNNIVGFMFRHYSPGDISAALARYTSGARKVLPPEALRRIFAIGKAALEHEKKKYLLVDVLAASDPEGETVKKLWPDFVNGLTRFELVKVFMSFTGGTNWIKNLRKSCQSSFTLASEKRPSYSYGGFHARLARIRKNGPDPAKP